MKVLLLNSDLARNRGDRAIAEGLIQLVRESYGDVEITGLSEHAERDRKWFNINFLNIDSQSLNPAKWLALAREARLSDVIYWGGGELLKDYTNQLGLWYWCVKILWIKLFNSNIYGAYQGIGPTGSAFSRRLIVFTVNRTRKFALRDNESYEKLIAWGANPNKLISATDPAVLPISDELNQDDFDELLLNGLDKEFVNNFISIAPRNWFHYRKGGLIPHRYKSIFRPSRSNLTNRLYRNQLSKLIEESAKVAKNVLLVPMHTTEDVDFCEDIVNATSGSTNIKVLCGDNVAPATLRKLLGVSRLMIGFRLHSNIVATSGNTPSINFYYVDKGRVYFDQIGQQDNAYPIEVLLDETFTGNLLKSVLHMLDGETEYRQEIQPRIDELRALLRTSFEKLHQ
jgi:polysaccharide pyruvyl transferase WcaK-like protein